MARIVAGFGTSHSPQLSVPAELWTDYARRDRHNPWLYRLSDGKHVDYDELLPTAPVAVLDELDPAKFRERHEANQRGIRWVGEQLAEVAPDVLIMFGDDQQEVFTKDRMPALCVFWADQVTYKGREARADDKALQALSDLYGHEPQHYPVDSALGKHIVEFLTESGFDPMHISSMPADASMSHAFGFVWRRIMPGRPIPTVPIHINTYYPPNQPTPDRCYALGQAVRAAVEAWDSDKRVAVLASGGLSHFVVDEEVDREALEAIRAKDRKRIAALPRHRLNAGTSEIRNWIAVGGATEHLEMELFDYVPCYRTPAGTGCAMAFAAWR